MFTSIFPEILFIEHSDDVSMHFVLQFFVLGLLFHGVFFFLFLIGWDHTRITDHIQLF